MNETVEELRNSIEAVNGVVEICAVEASGLLKRAGLSDAVLKVYCASLDEKPECDWLTPQENSALYGADGLTPDGLAEKMAKRILFRKQQAVRIFACKDAPD